MNPEQLRHELREMWLSYYRDNRHWLSRLEIWITYNHQRRPSSSFILATVSVLNPQLTQLLPLLVDLNHDPDQMVEALGLNFNPEEALGAITPEPVLGGQPASTSHRLPSAAAPAVGTSVAPSSQRTVPQSRSTQTAPNSNQVLERPSRPIPRRGGHESTAELTRRVNVRDEGCEGRDRPRSLARPHRKYPV